MDISLPAKRVAVHVQDANSNPVANATLDTNGVYKNMLSIGGLTAEEHSQYNQTSPTREYALTNAAGDAVLWLFPTPLNSGYAFTLAPSANTPFAVFNVQNVSVTQDTSEIIVLQYVTLPTNTPTHTPTHPPTMMITPTNTPLPPNTPTLTPTPTTILTNTERLERLTQNSLRRFALLNCIIRGSRFLDRDEGVEQGVITVPPVRVLSLLPCNCQWPCLRSRG